MYEQALYSYHLGAPETRQLTPDPKQAMVSVGSGFPVLVFAQSDGTEAAVRALAHEFRGRGSLVWLAAPEGDLPVGVAAHPVCAPLLSIQSFYRAINTLALCRGYNPDLPPHLKKVTETV